MRLLRLRLRLVRFVRLPSCAGMVPVMPILALFPEAEGSLSCKAETLSAVTVIPGQSPILRAAGVPQVLSGCSAGRSLLASTDAQWFWMATRASQSSARSLFVPATMELAAVSTKVPSVQPAADRSVMLPVSAVGGGEVVGGGVVVVVEDVVVGGGEVVVVADVVGGGEVVVVDVVGGDEVVVGGDEVVVDEEQLAARIANEIAAIMAAKIVLLVISRITRGGVVADLELMRFWSSVSLFGFCIGSILSASVSNYRRTIISCQQVVAVPLLACAGALASHRVVAFICWIAGESDSCPQSSRHRPSQIVHAEEKCIEAATFGWSQVA